MPQADGPFGEPSRRLFVHWMALRMESILGRFHHGIFHNNRFHCEPRIDRGLLSFPSHKSGAQLHSPHRMMHILLAKSTVSFSPGGLSHARARKVSTYKTHAKKSIRMSGHADMDGHHKHLCMWLPSNGTSSTNTRTQTPTPSTDTDTRTQTPGTDTQTKSPNTDRYPSKDSEHIHPNKTSKHTDAKHPIESRPA